MDTITPVEQRALAPEPWQRYTGLYSRKLSVFNPNRLPLLRRFGEPNERRLLPLAQVAPADLDIPILSQLPPSQFSLGDALEPRPLKVVRLNATRGVPVGVLGEGEEHAGSDGVRSDECSLNVRWVECNGTSAAWAAALTTLSSAYVWTHPAVLRRKRDLAGRCGSSCSPCFFATAEPWS